jgi:phosphotransferase system HPr (HPr) family protein
MVVPTLNQPLIEKIDVANKFGLHLRAAAKLAQLANQFECTIHIRVGDRTANAKSVLNLIALAVHEKKVLEILVEGPGAQKAMDAVRGLVRDKFGERE